ncbi:hypothetical protein [Pseudosulfitobacter pseudonitzschiae]|uniref:hypothetical protein n=1 Tax=Pseudosulfitobacter pseudonitzschiae TaxID=1402135 RepID=UPI001E549AAC|nr:hypothetical protein [Pseudosulfitobacter pseudonitzschiae]MCD2313133.1 hypothetical protein [Pseudosulfitobacter pseudonitzschiae]
MSSPKFSARTEVLTYRQQFAHTWQEFITATFESPAHAAMVFRVDPSTAENWFTGSNAPQGWVVGRALSDPTLRPQVLAKLAGAA